MYNDAISFRRRLPHVHPKYAALFITFRTNEKIPAYLQSEYANHINRLSLIAEKSDNIKEARYQNNKILFAKYDKMLHQTHIKLNLLENPEVAKAIADTIHDLAKTHYHLYAYTIMPNHVHLLIKPMSIDDETVKVSEIMKLLKGRSARKVNQILGRQGSLWYREYYDHFPRNMREVENIVAYILENPIKAGLTDYETDWEWSWVNV